MKRATRKILSLVMAFALALGVFTLAPITASAATPTDVTGGTQIIKTPGLYNIATANNGATITVAVNDVALTGTHADLGVVISAGVTLTLKDAHITRSGGNPIRADSTGCKLILVGDNSATCSINNYAGVNVQSGASLIIEGPGKLTARGYNYSAGIGGGSNGNGNDIIILNSSVTATGGNEGSGAIGGGVGGTTFNTDGGNGNTIIIDATSTVQANGGGGGGDYNSGDGADGTEPALT